MYACTDGVRRVSDIVSMFLASPYLSSPLFSPTFVSYFHSIPYTLHSPPSIAPLDISLSLCLLSRLNLHFHFHFHYYNRLDTQGVPFVTDIVRDSSSCPTPMESNNTMDPQSRPQGLGVHMGVGVGIPKLTPWGQKLLLTVYRTYTGYSLIRLDLNRFDFI